jgi:hypothetical protein
LFLVVLLDLGVKNVYELSLFGGMFLHIRFKLA